MCWIILILKQTVENSIDLGACVDNIRVLFLTIPANEILVIDNVNQSSAWIELFF